ncbi:MAG: hypothetical protein LBS43_03110, partial [Prevotellaceae bacterium]|nr:hypothetical protein [Prevotellaceae bacterium]
MMKKSIMMTSLTKMCVLVAVLFAFTSNGMYAQTTTGKDFWVAFGQFKGLDGTKNGSMIYDSRHLDIQIKIVATAETYVDFYFSANSQLNQTDVHVSANTVYTRILKDNEKAAVYSYSDNVLGTTTSNSLHITSDQPVSVYALIRYNGMGDATNVLPINALGKEYYHISYTGSSAYLKDAMTLVATEDDTDITIYNNNNTQIVNHTNLSKGKVVYYALDGEMSGYRVVSDKPIAHFDTHRSAVIPNVATNWENLYQQMAPVNSWGKTFFVPSLKNVANQERLRIRVVASQDGTEIEYKGANIIGARKTLGKGQFAELEIDNTNNGCIITSNKPVGVCSFLLSHSPGNTSTYGGPANVWIPPVEQSVPVTTISSFIPNNSPNTFSTIDANYAIIVTPTATKNETKINGLTPTAALSWTDREGYSFAQYALTDDSPHTFSNQAGLTVLVAGLGDHESYYYLAGASMYNLNMAFTVNGVNHQQAMGTTLCENNVEFKAKVEYAKNPLTLKWFIDGVEQYAYRDKLSCYATLAQGNHTVRMDVVDLYEVEQSISTNFTVETPVLTVPSEMRVNENVTLLSSANGTWKSSDNNVATVTPAGVATGVAEGTVRFTFTSAAGCTSVSDFVTVKPDRKTANDTIALLYNTSVSFNAVVDGMLNCNTNDITLNIMDGVKHGALTENNKIYTYTPTRNWYGIDSVKYSVTCNPQSVGSYDATVYFIVSKPKSMYNVACPDATIVIGMNKIQDVQYYWYNAPTGGNPSPPTAIDSLILTKNSSDIETRYVEARYKGFKSSRYEISVHKSENCGDINPTGCIVDGQVLFSEDFGGNNENDPRISLTKLPENATKYTFLSGDDKIKADQYALVKYVDNGYTPWHQKFSDHTHFNDMTKGYMFLVDASDNAGKFYETTITGLCGNINKMYFSAWVANEIKKDWNSSIIPDDPVLKFELSDNDGNIIGTYVTSKVPRDNTDAIKWRNYGFTFDPKGQSSLTLRIYNNTGGWNGNDFALDDIEIRVCFPPITVENKLFDTTFVGKSYDFKAAYIDDGTFTTLDNQLAAQWEYSANNIDWNLVAGTTKIESATAIGSTYTINSAALSDKGYYRFVVSNPSTINNKNCRVVSKSIALAVEDSNIVADTIALLYNTEVTFDALANDVYPCSSNVVVNIVPNSGLTMGSMTKNSDNTFTYTPHTNQYGIDNVEYSIQCPSGNIKTAKIYFIIS